MTAARRRISGRDVTVRASHIALLIPAGYPPPAMRRSYVRLCSRLSETPSPRGGNPAERCADDVFGARSARSATKRAACDASSGLTSVEATASVVAGNREGGNAHVAVDEDELVKLDVDRAALLVWGAGARAVLDCCVRRRCHQNRDLYGCEEVINCQPSLSACPRSRTCSTAACSPRRPSAAGRRRRSWQAFPAPRTVPPCPQKASHGEERLRQMRRRKVKRGGGGRTA